ncbi:MAG: hypothetical protein KY469_13375 [Actinobacteria bacterium]|nr:hypothetical protein [Actinomycetota bacterium]
MPRTLLLSIVIAIALTGCGGDDTMQANLADVPTGPLTGLPPCGEAPEPLAEPPEVEGLVLPEGAEITQVTETAPLTNVTAYVERTPVQIRLELEADPELEILVSEDEVLEAELLVTDGEHRTFVKARAICDRASVVVGVVAPEEASDVVPVPTGAAS